MHVNTSIFCVNKQIFVIFKSKKLFFYSDVCGSSVITPYTTSVRSSVFETACVLRAAVCCSQCDLSSPRCIVTCTRTFRRQVRGCRGMFRSLSSLCRVDSPTALRVHSFPSLAMAVFSSKICWSLSMVVAMI